MKTLADTVTDRPLLTPAGISPRSPATPLSVLRPTHGKISYEPEHSEHRDAIALLAELLARAIQRRAKLLFLIPNTSDAELASDGGKSVHVSRRTE